METLFPLPPVGPPGFSYIPNFIQREEERELLARIDGIERHTFIFQGYEAKRRVASFGFDYNFESRKLKKGSEIPKYFQSLIDRVAQQLLMPPEAFSELLITEYPAGALINWHRDAFPFDIIAGLSLAAPCIFRFRPHDKAKQNRRSIYTFSVEPRSLYLITGEARSDWEHSTLPVSSPRFSITLRTLMAQSRATQEKK